MKSKYLTLLLGAAAAAAPVYAHHSFTATYDEGKTVEIEGTLVQFMFRNPHAFVHVMAPDENGEMQRWGVEWGGAGALTGQGVTRDSKPFCARLCSRQAKVCGWGSRATIEACGARAAANRLNAPITTAMAPASDSTAAADIHGVFRIIRAANRMSLISGSSGSSGS